MSVMIEYLVLLSCLGFLAFLVPGRHRKYAAIVGWTFIILSLFANLDYYFAGEQFPVPADGGTLGAVPVHHGKISPEGRRAGHEPVPGCSGRIHHLRPVRLSSRQSATGSSVSLSGRSSGFLTCSGSASALRTGISSPGTISGSRSSSGAPASRASRSCSALLPQFRQTQSRRFSRS